MKRSTLSFFIIFIFSLALLVACKSKQPLEPVTIETVKTITKVERDTIIKTEADSSYYFSYIDCVNGKPIIRQPDPKKDPGAPKSKAGKNLLIPNVTLQGNKLEVDCYKKAQDLFFNWKETYIEENTKTSVPVYIEKPFKWYHKMLMWAGGIFFLLSAFGLILKFRK